MKPFRVECLNTTNGIAIASLLALPLLLASASLTFASSFQRLVDRVDSPPAARLIDGVWKRILPAKYGKLTFTVDPSIPRPRLHFHVGSDPGSEGGTVRFEISILPKGQAPTIVFQRDVRIHGWEEQEVDLSGLDLEDAQIVLRKRLIDGPRKRLFTSFWGDPVILSRGSPPSSGSVVLISLDTLRADYVGAYGNRKVHTPVLDSLAGSGILYEYAYSPSSWTLPSHASLFYGRFLASIPRPNQRGPDGAGPMQSLAEIFRGSGYLTAGFTGGGYVSKTFGFHRGFDTYFTFHRPNATGNPCPPDRFDGPLVFEQAQNWLRKRGNVPFFLFLHTYDIHDRCPFRIPGAAPPHAWRKLGTEGRERLRTYYRELVQRTDQRVGELLNVIKDLGIEETTLIIVTSDHGEAFWEHGVRGHGCRPPPYEEIVRVPLILRDPSRLEPSVRISEPVSLIDVAPTVLALKNLPRRSWMQGKRLPGSGLGGAGIPRAVFSQCGDRLAVRLDHHKLITSRSGANPDELYDLDRDGAEKHNLVEEKPQIAARLQEQAAHYWKMTEAGKNEEPRQPDSQERLDDETKEQLRALGYLGE